METNLTEIQKKLLALSKPRSKEAIEKAEKRKEERNKKSVFNRPTKQCSAYGDKPQDCELYPDCEDCSGNIV